PGALVTAYFELFKRRGGRFFAGEAVGLTPASHRWRTSLDGHAVGRRQAVIALGPWAPGLPEQLGRRPPLLGPRRYHMHYREAADARLNHLLLDAEVGYVIAPMARGVRLTTGAEFARRDAAPTPIQLGKAEKAAREIFPLGERVDPQPWK